MRKIKTKQNGRSKSQTGGSLQYVTTDFQDWQMATHKETTDVSTTPLLGVLDTNIVLAKKCNNFKDVS
jgi:hypothetical protein